VIAMSKAEKTRQFIVEKTAPIFNVKGYAGTSISDMTEATGLTKGSIYGNFANKDEVALAAFDHNMKKVHKILIDEMTKHELIKDKLLVYIHVYANFLKFPFPEGGCPVLNTAVDADDTHPQLKKKVSDAIITWKNSIVRLIGTGVERKEFKHVEDPELFAVTIIAMIEGAIMIAKATGKTNYRNMVMQSVEKMINELI
jgi:TetR/AcrR family transcriptional repressor of nem operon